MKKTTAISCVFLDIGGVLLTDGWDHLARKRAATNFKLEWAEMEDRHHLTFEIYEEGKITLEEYLSLVVFNEKRPFTRNQFRRFMFAQSEPFPEMIALVAQLKAPAGYEDCHGQQRRARAECISNSEVQTGSVYGLLHFLLLRSHSQARRGHFQACSGHSSGAGFAGSLYRQYADVRSDRGRAGSSKHPSHGLQLHPSRPIRSRAQCC